MEKPEGELLLKPLKSNDPEFTYGTAPTEEYRDDKNGKDVERLPNTAAVGLELKPPLAKPEKDDDDLENPATIAVEIDDENIPSNDKNGLYGDTIDLADRAGGFPYAPGFGAGLNAAAPSINSDIPDVNIYQQKKTVAQGMMDLALFSANANQLRYVLESSSHMYYYPGVVLISFSLLFQVAVGVGLLWNTMYDVKDDKQICLANKVNNFTIVGIFLITVVNVFISAFGTTAGGSTT